MISLSKLEEIKDLRKVWEHEALDFTPWLAEEENIMLLGDALGLEISVDETESPVGEFRADILATEVGTGKKIIIENQLENTNHEHLGKLITYAAGKSADIVIWVVKNACEEHKAAIEWLNSNIDAKIGFFLCEIKLYSIGNSQPAVKFEVIEKPNDWITEVKKEELISETQQKRYDFWLKFQDYAFQKHGFQKNFNRKKCSYEAWLDFAIGSGACWISVVQVRKHNELHVKLYIGNDKELFSAFFEHKSEIEKNTALKFAWDKMEGRKASQIVIKNKSVNFDDEKNIEQLFDWIIDKMLKIKKEFVKYF